MVAVTAAEAKRDLTRLIEQVNSDRIDIEIVAERGSAVLMSKDAYDSLMETNYLLSSPQNAQRLLASLASARSGTTEHKCSEP
ncbi:type II toxin-antitoxin system prevent-host-death family antitoxin [Arthrobacter sp. zg-Y1171]|uniref:type II toxin-antitoxin system Phd/YefM family antitoxin n=1 Tax=Arthrobacter sp. zg-Y1171 TaxID=2964610 RepID=UPI0028AC4AFF|nr:type II toxin-antitoxin system prevent-host-death family antitoxin [Arthrobacter sp. zg-Y1171]